MRELYRHHMVCLKSKFECVKFLLRDSLKKKYVCFCVIRGGKIWSRLPISHQKRCNNVWYKAIFCQTGNLRYTMQVTILIRLSYNIFILIFDLIYHITIFNRNTTPMGKFFVFLLFKVYFWNMSNPLTLTWLSFTDDISHQSGEREVHIQRIKIISYS